MNKKYILPLVLLLVLLLFISCTKEEEIQVTVTDEAFSELMFAYDISINLMRNYDNLSSMAGIKRKYKETETTSEAIYTFDKCTPIEYSNLGDPIVLAENVSGKVEYDIEIDETILEISNINISYIRDGVKHNVIFYFQWDLLETDNIVYNAIVDGVSYTSESVVELIPWKK